MAQKPYNALDAKFSYNCHCGESKFWYAGVEQNFYCYYCVNPLCRLVSRRIYPKHDVALEHLYVIISYIGIILYSNKNAT